MKGEVFRAHGNAGQSDYVRVSYLIKGFLAKYDRKDDADSAASSLAKHCFNC